MKKQKEISKATQLSESIEIRVRFNEADPLGIVWHGNYIKYFEDGREAFGRKYGITYLDIEQQGYATPIVKSVCEHKKTVRYGEVLRVETYYVECSAAKMIFQYVIYNQKGEMVCKGETIQVFTSLKEGELSLYNPPFYERWKERFLKK